MSIPLGFLAILTEGPAYGSQLHSEFIRRAVHRHHLNSGQVYSTLERLRKHRLIQQAGTTADDLPLYELTPLGGHTAQLWLSGHDVTEFTTWDDLEDQVLISASLRAGDPFTVITRYLGAIEIELAASKTATTCAEAAAATAHTLQLGAARSWLDIVAKQLSENPELFRYHRTTERPRRGRRPAQTIQ